MSSKLKVLQVIPKLGYGGAETGCYDLAHYLHEQGCKSYIATSGGELLEFINKKKVKLLRLPVHSKNPVIILLNSIILIFVILILNINVVHARSRAPAWSCLIATKITGRKFVTTFHGTYNFKSSIKKFYNSVMLKSHLIIAGSNFIFSHINDNYSKYLNPKKKFLVIFRGINTDYFNKKKIKETDEQKLIKKWNIDKEKKIFLLPGRLTPWKGQEMFIESLSRLKNNQPNKKFTAIILGGDQGRKIFKKKLQRLVEQHRLIEEVIFIDNFNIMPLAYKISDVIFSCSVEPEAFGRVSVEAQAMEKPIIASNIGGSLETIKHEKTGFLFSAGDINDLYKNMSEIFDLYPATLEVMGTEGRKNVIKKFNVEKMCFSTYSEYKKLIN
jgi:glycosyltransferase involved in cell wall biosynthesis|tara:strand:+ start:5854 stop:7008 length:1155 start_codon:yes stop_codon:yes gene_type:complete